LVHRLVNRVGRDAQVCLALVAEGRIFPEDQCHVDRRLSSHQSASISLKTAFSRSSTITMRRNMMSQTICRAAAKRAIPMLVMFTMIGSCAIQIAVNLRVYSWLGVQGFGGSTAWPGSSPLVMGTNLSRSDCD